MQSKHNDQIDIRLSLESKNLVSFGAGRLTSNGFFPHKAITMLLDLDWSEVPRQLLNDDRESEERIIEKVKGVCKVSGVRLVNIDLTKDLIAQIIFDLLEELYIDGKKAQSIIVTEEMRGENDIMEI